MRHVEDAFRSLSRITLPLCALLALAGCPSSPDDNPDAGPDAGPGVAWNPAFDTTDVGSLSGVWGSGPNDVFVVGGDANSGLVYHYDGVEWLPMQIPVVPLQVWVFGFGPDDVYTVGLDGSAMHYDGTAWVTLETNTTQDLWGVWGASPDDMWIVGGNVFDSAPVILHNDGQAITPVVLDPAQNPLDVKSIFKVWGIGTKVFAVGQLGLILEYDGQEWLRRPAGARADADFISLWGTGEDNIVAVGGRGNGRIATYDGTEWSTIAPQGIGGLNAVFMEQPGVALVGGLPGYIGTFDLSTQEVIAEPVFTDRDVHAIWGDGAGRVYAVGGTFLPPHIGVAWVRTLTE